VRALLTPVIGYRKLAMEVYAVYSNPLRYQKL
jgi:hypothetical protein